MILGVRVDEENESENDKKQIFERNMCTQFNIFAQNEWY